MRAGHRSLDDWLSDVLVNAQKIVTHTASISFEEFAASEPIRDLVMKKIENMGEAARYIRDLHPEFYQNTVEIPWRDLVNMRNRLSHGYFDVSPVVLWRTARQDIPAVLAILVGAIERRRQR